MSYAVEEEAGFTVVGIATRTSNSSAHEIGALWGKFYETGVAAQISSRIDEDIYSIYSEYESDHTGSFTVLIGYAVPEDSLAPQGMSKKAISAGSYAVFHAAGDLPESIVKAWSSIWNTPLDRVYGTDFEQYQNDGAVTVHVGVR